MFAVVANVKSDTALRSGALVWLLYCHGDGQRPFVRGLSHEGHAIRKYVAYNDLENFRPKWVPEHLRDKFLGGFVYARRPEAEEAAKTLAQMWGRP